MKSHFETVTCPDCKSIELLEVIHSFPHWTYSGYCSKCNCQITKELWNSNGHIWNDDILNVTRKMKSNSVDLVCTDPPYAVRKKTDDNKENWDDKEYFDKFVDVWLSENLRIAKHTVIWFCAGKMIPHIMRSVNPELLHRIHIWDKPAGTQYAGASHNNIWYSIEVILVFSKDKEITTSYGKEESFNYDALKYSTIAKKKYNHVSSKPTELISTLIQHYSKEGETVFDGFGGSGTTAEAAIKTKRNYILVERDTDHYQTIIKRINDLNSQFDLFR